MINQKYLNKFVRKQLKLESSSIMSDTSSSFSAFMPEPSFQELSALHLIIYEMLE